jgi:glucose/arabinose dehydrogenase
MSLTIGNSIGNALRICCVALVPLLVACPGGQSPDGPLPGQQQQQPGTPQEQPGPGEPPAPAASACAGTTAVVTPQAPAPTPVGGLTLAPVNIFFLFTDPVFMTAPPMNLSDPVSRLFVVERGGTIQVLERSIGFPLGTFLNISPLVLGGPDGGLLGLAFDPQYASNGRFYVSYVDTNGNTVVARYLVSADPNVADPNSGAVIITSPAPLGAQNSGMIAFGPGDFLYIGWGGGSSGDPNNVSQNLGDLRGKILSIDIRPGAEQPPLAYGIPSDNPCLGQPGARGEIWSMGLRNPRRFTFDNGNLYIGEVGETLEEINVSAAIGRGSNYGWRIMDGRGCFSPSSGCDPRLITQPRYDYADAGGACSVIGGHVYRGADIPGLAGTYFYADSCTGSVLSFRFDGQQITEHVSRSSLAPPPGSTITSLGRDSQGEFYITTQQGGLFRIMPGGGGGGGGGGNDDDD